LITNHLESAAIANTSLIHKPENTLHCDIFYFVLQAELADLVIDRLSGIA
jgi:hypothetical protein